jgi:hypothetical protein
MLSEHVAACNCLVITPKLSEYHLSVRILEELLE